jgi:hypothetical protein
MPFTTAISFTQGADCSQFTIVDASTYNIEAAGTFSARKLTIQKSDGTYLKIGNTTYNQFVWPFASGNNLVISGVDDKNQPYIGADYAFTVTLALTSSSPVNGSVYTKTELPVFTCYTMSAFYTNTGKMAINPGLEKDYKFVKDVMRLILEKESAQKAGLDGDIGASQSCLDRAKFVSDSLKIGY